VKIFLLGATGNSGRRILRLALQRAHEVTAFVRDETKLLSLVDRPIPPNLHVSIGDISKSADIARVMGRTRCRYQCSRQCDGGFHLHSARTDSD
jgi:putative NADH-flavin reductase